MEESDADRMLAELVRVIVRALDMPSWVNLPISDAAGCADASLYRRFHAAGLTRLTCFPQFAGTSASHTGLIRFGPYVRVASVEEVSKITMIGDAASRSR